MKTDSVKTLEETIVEEAKKMTLAYDEHMTVWANEDTTSRMTASRQKIMEASRLLMGSEG